MRIVPVPDATALAQTAAATLATAIRAKPHLRLVVATGRTPLATYQQLAGDHQRGALPTDRLRVYQLDAYRGLPPDDPRALYRWMREAFLDPLGVPPENVVRLPGDAPDPAAACRAYDARVRAEGGYDLAVLGLGPNGHLGFNEPPSPSDAPTRLVTLAPESVHSNAAYWGGEEHVPREALTAGLDLLLSARTVLLLVAGAHKRDVLHATLHGPVTPDLPASYLQRCPHALILADGAALG